MGGGSFLAGFLDGMNRRRGELHQEESQKTDRERAGLMHILDAATKSESLDPTVAPQLVKMMLEAQGADKREVEGISQAAQILFGQGYETTGTKITGYESGKSEPMAGDETGPVVRGDNGPVPVAQFGAKIRKPVFMSPDDMAARQAAAEAARQRALLPVLREKTKIDTEHDLAVETARGEYRAKAAGARAKAQEELLTKRYGLMAAKDLEARTQAKLAAMQAVDPNATYEEARASAAAELNNEYGLKAENLKAKIGYTKAATDAIPKKLFLEGERVKQGWERVNQGWDGLDLREQTLALEEAYKGALLELKGNTARQQAYAAEAAPIMQEVRQTEQQRARLESEVAQGLAVAPNVGATIQAYAAKLTELKEQLNGITSKFTEGQTAPKMNVRQPTPRRGSRYVRPKVSTQQLDDLLK